MKTAICGALALTLLPVAWGETTSAGTVTTVTAGLDYAELKLSSGGVARIEFREDNVARVRISPKGTFSKGTSEAVLPSDGVAPVVQIHDSPDSLFLLSSRMKIQVRKNPLSIQAFWPDDQPMVADAATPSWDNATGRVIDVKFAPPGEHYLGLGARGGAIDRRGRLITLKNSDACCYKEDSDPLYISIPFYYGLLNGRAYGLFLDNPASPFFDFAHGNKDTVVFGAEAGELDYYLIAGPATADVARAYARLTGNTPLPPKWALGFHQSRYSYYTQQEVLDLAHNFRDRKIPLDVVWLDIDFMDKFRQFTWNPTAFPDPAAMTRELHGLNVRQININEPLLRSDDPAWNDYARRGFFLRGPDNKPLINNIWFGDVSWIDYSGTWLRGWYGARLTRFLSTGIDGLWNDLNEPAQNYMPEAIYSFDGQPRSDVEARNLYAFQMVQTTLDSLNAARPGQRQWQIARSGYAGIQRYAANWSGDANSDWASLKINVQMTASMGLSGQNFFGHDAGGFVGTPSAELFTRWMQLGLYTPLFRNHAWNEAPHREPWLLPDPEQTVVYKTIDQRYRMLPLLYSLMDRTSRTGDPVVAPLAYYFPADETAIANSTQFLLGQDILVAPVFEEGQRQKSVYLPKGVLWIDAATNTEYEGDKTVTVDAPLDRIPVFYREGAIVPSAPLTQSTVETPSEVTVDIYPGVDNSFALYEDDGVSLNYQDQKQFARTNISTQHGTEGLEIKWQRDGGEYPSPLRTWKLRVHRFTEEPRTILLDGVETKAWQWDAATSVISMELPTSASTSVVIRP